LDDGPDRFVYYHGAVSRIGKVASKVQFLNEDGDAEVTLADGNGGVVNIGEGKEDALEEIEEDPGDDEAEEDEDP
jgi:hypothetical protein